MDDWIMERLQEEFLNQADRCAEFSVHHPEYYLIKVHEGHGIYTKVSRSKEELRLNVMPKAFLPCPASESGVISPAKDSTLRCVLHQIQLGQRSRRFEYLPFESSKEMRTVFSTLSLPSSYFQIAGGRISSAQAVTLRDPNGNPVKYQLIAHCVSHQGDWDMALSHEAAKHETSMFWSVDGRIDRTVLFDSLGDLDTFKDYASHPMLVPCIMFAANLRMSELRRLSIKDKLQRLEDRVRHMASDFSDQDQADQPSDLTDLFEILHSCRRDHASREGRYDFWRRYHEALEEGFKYFAETLKHTPDTQLSKAHNELWRWKTVTQHKIESLMARYNDHVKSVNNVSDMLYNLVQQREIRIQSRIARAAQHDSEDMKFLAVLGSIFLPASLVASILNVPEFQFAKKGKLFGAYVAITLSLVTVVVLSWFGRHRLKRRWHNIRDKHHRVKSQRASKDKATDTDGKLA